MPLDPIPTYAERLSKALVDAVQAHAKLRAANHERDLFDASRPEPKMPRGFHSAEAFEQFLAERDAWNERRAQLNEAVKVAKAEVRRIVGILAELHATNIWFQVGDKAVRGYFVDHHEGARIDVEPWRDEFAQELA